MALPFLEGGFALETLVGGGLIGLPLVILGFLAASRCREVPERGNARKAKLAIVALLAGIGVGAANLRANVTLAATDPAMRALLQDHFAEPLPWARVASVAVVEEIVSRLFLMSVVAWIASRFVNDARTVFLTALIVSAFFFAVPHLLGRPLPTHSALAALYASGVVVKSGLAGLVLGWLFWRWGLPYAMVPLRRQWCAQGVRVGAVLVRTEHEPPLQPTKSLTDLPRPNPPCSGEAKR